MSFFSKHFTVYNRKIGANAPVFIIAEAGVAHFGSMEKALALVDLAVSAKADAVKFQVFKTEELISTESEEWIDRLKPKELPFNAFREIRDYCSDKGILFFATAHDEPSLEYLETLKIPLYKIGSGELGNLPFIKKIALKGKPIILSTGMYSLEDVGKALSVFQEAGNPDLAILHCITSYPTPPADVNLKAIGSIFEQLDVITGYSDHTQGIHFPVSAVALGARVIEKHISLDFNVPNAQDWKVACGPDDLHLMIGQIRDIEQGLGSGVKNPTESEQNSLSWALKSLVAARDISKGEVITRALLQAKRPGNGISPEHIDDVIGKKAKVKILKDSLVLWEHLM